MKARWIPWAAFLAILSLVAVRTGLRALRPAYPCSLEVLGFGTGNDGDSRVVLRLVNHTRHRLECLGRGPGQPVVWVVPLEREPGPDPGLVVVPSALVTIDPGDSLMFTQRVPSSISRFRITVNPRPDPRRYQWLAWAGRISPGLVARLWPDPILVSTPELDRLQAVGREVAARQALRPDGE